MISVPHLSYGGEADASFVRLLLGRFPAQRLEARVQQVVALVDSGVGPDLLQLAALHLDGRHESGRHVGPLRAEIASERAPPSL